jgi:hypothetical protein
MVDLKSFYWLQKLNRLIKKQIRFRYILRKSITRWINNLIIKIFDRLKELKWLIKNEFRFTNK